MPHSATQYRVYVFRPATVTFLVREKTAEFRLARNMQYPQVSTRVSQARTHVGFEVTVVSVWLTTVTTTQHNRSNAQKTHDLNGRCGFTGPRSHR